MNTSENPISLLELLEESKVVIPILQRDYAQGREEKEYILKQFLKDIKTTLQRNETLELDFIYGREAGEIFYPFDGQQRITTLWLLYLYLLWQNNDKDEEKIDILKKFSYQTRISAEEFCRVIPEKIFSLKIDETLPKVSDLIKIDETLTKVSDLIKKQKWFFSEWQEDPTIKAMLSALDTIQSEFKGSYTDLFLGNFGNIKFLKLEPEKNDKSSLSDDLYIKMNARGKPLTNFENFKADIFKFLESRTTIDNNKDIIKKYIIELASLIDNDWTDIFWENKHKPSENEAFIDEIYLEFFNRCAINEFLSDGNPAQSEEVLKKLGYESNGEFVPYEDFKIYENYIEDILENIKKILTQENIDRINKILKNKPDWRKINFIPIYKEKQENSSRPQVESITQAKRVIFYALCLYFINIKQEEIKEDKLEDWFYFASNMVGSGIENLDAMISAIKRIKELSARCNDIIAYLSTLDDKGSHVGFNEAQLKEEIQKAKKIKEIPDIKEKIRDAENLIFSSGTIRFLYKDEKGNIDWTNFDNKLKKLKELFGDEKVTNDDELIKEGRIEILKILLSYCENFENLQSFPHKEKYLFEPKYNVFKRYFFINDVMSKSVHNLLMKNGVAEEIKLKGDNGEDIPPDDPRYKILYWLVKTDLLSKIAEKWGLRTYKEAPMVYLTAYYGYALYVKRTRTNVIEFAHEGRDKKLEEAVNNKIIKIKNDVIKYKFYNGWGRTFEFEGILYTWNNERCDTLNDFIDAKKDEKPAS